MYFDLSQPQKLLMQSVREFCRREFPAERVRELMETEDAIDDKLWTEIADQGWIGLHLPEQYGGLELGPVELAVVAEELGRCCAPGPWLTANWAATLLAAAGGPIAEQYLPDVIEGKTLATVAAIEAGGSWNADSSQLQTRLAQSGVLAGEKDLVQHAAQAKLLVTLVDSDNGPCLVAVPTDADGVQLSLTKSIDQTRRLYRCQLLDVQLADENVIAVGDAAESAWRAGQRVASVLVAAESLGLMQWMLESTVEYAKTRKQFDRVIGSFQSVQHKCADMLLMAESCRSAVWNAAWSLQENVETVDHAIAVAKAYASDAVRQTGNLAVQVHGGIGFTWEHDLQLYYRRAKADEYLLGDASHHREALAKLML